MSCAVRVVCVVQFIFWSVGIASVGKMRLTVIEYAN